MQLQCPRKFAGQRQLRIALVMYALLGLAGCASAVFGPANAHATAADSPRSTVSGSDREAEAALLQRINASIGAAPCDTDAQCRTVGLGANACGGPAAWRPWSVQNHDEQGKALQALADQLSILQRRRQAQSGMVSTCRYLPDPGAVCQAQHCVLKKTSDPAN